MRYIWQRISSQNPGDSWGDVSGIFLEAENGAIVGRRRNCCLAGERRGRSIFFSLILLLLLLLASSISTLGAARKRVGDRVAYRGGATSKGQ